MEDAIKEADFVPIMENCRQLVADGITTVEEVERMVGREM